MRRRLGQNPRKQRPIESAAVWEFRYDSELDGQVKADARAGELKITAKKNVITGTASRGGVVQTNKWTGLFITGRATLIQLREDGLNGYARVFSAREVKAGRFVGTWYDNDGGSGDFELTLKKK